MDDKFIDFYKGIGRERDKKKLSFQSKSSGKKVE